jgi:SAM-dependent methyltransferase
VLDAGCGTGANLAFLRETLQPSYLGAFDVSDRALQLAAEADAGADLYRSDICRPEIREERLDLVTSCDVLCVPGLDEARPGVNALATALAPGGTLILNLPAFQWLYCGHDRSFHTTQRFTVREVRELLRDVGLEPVLVTYRVFFVFPLIVLARLPRILRERLGGSPRTEEATSDIAMPASPINSILYQCLRLENWLIDRGLRFPFGSSVLAAGRKPRDAGSPVPTRSEGSAR